MKKVLILKLTSLFLLLLIFIMLIPGCFSKDPDNLQIPETTFSSNKEWHIVVWIDKGETNLALLTQSREYDAKEIISLSDNSIRFIDLDGKEVYATYDWIEIKEK